MNKNKVELHFIQDIPVYKKSIRPLLKNPFSLGLLLLLTDRQISFLEMAKLLRKDSGRQELVREMIREGLVDFAFPYFSISIEGIRVFTVSIQNAYSMLEVEVLKGLLRVQLDKANKIHGRWRTICASFSAYSQIFSVGTGCVTLFLLLAGLVGNRLFIMPDVGLGMVIFSIFVFIEAKLMKEYVERSQDVEE